MKSKSRSGVRPTSISGFIKMHGDGPTTISIFVSSLPCVLRVSDANMNLHHPFPEVYLRRAVWSARERVRHGEVKVLGVMPSILGVRAGQARR